MSQRSQVSEATITATVISHNTQHMFANHDKTTDILQLMKDSTRISDQSEKLNSAPAINT